MRPRHTAGVIRPVAILVILAVVMSGCTSMHRVAVVPTPPASALAVSPGDEVRLTLLGGDSVRFTVERIEPDAIIARGGGRYALADVAALERRGFSGPKTTLLLVGVPAGLFLFAMLAFALEGK